MEEGLQLALSARGLTVSSFPDKGRALISTKDFSPGDIIISQDPYASTPNYSSTSACDSCFTTNNVKRCSSCKIAWYCGSICQKSEWKLHRVECEALKTLPGDRKKMLTPTIRLMVKLLLKKKLQSEKVLPETAIDNYDLLRALVSHITDIDEKQLVLYAQMANLVNLVIPLSDISIKEIAENFSRLACNAHTICDNELQSIGTGIYPIISIINHSCLPNSILVFEGQTAVVRAVDHIASGSEISISYVETAATTTKRRNDLKEHYFFTCLCRRCCQANCLEDAKLEGYRCTDTECDGLLLHGIGNQAFTCQKCGLSWDQQTLNKALTEEKHLSEICQKSLLKHNHHEARSLYKMLEQHQKKLFYPLSIPLLKTRDDLMKAKYLHRCIGGIEHQLLQLQLSDTQNVVKKIHIKEISLVKVPLHRHGGKEATWDTEANMRARYRCSFRQNTCTVVLGELNISFCSYNYQISMELRDWNEALIFCRLTLPAYEGVYPANHVMLGLQYYTCGKLEWLLGLSEEALVSLTKAAEVLRIAYGTSVPFMRELLNKLEEARAEASYKCRSHADTDFTN